MKHYYAVMGNPISHSLSPKIHALFATEVGIDLHYERILGDTANFETQIIDFFDRGGCGLNITLPFKERAFAIAEQHSSRCLKAGAANTLWVKENRIHADNTDGIGFVRDASRYFSFLGRDILILGAGGAARGLIQPVLDAQPRTLMLWNRTHTKTSDLIDIFPDIQAVTLDGLMTVDCIINATSASLSGFSLNVPESIWHGKPFCYDLSYSLDSTTPFASRALEYGCKALDGLGMLVEQAAEAFFLWHGLRPDTQRALTALLPTHCLAERGMMRS